MYFELTYIQAAILKSIISPIIMIWSEQCDLINYTLIYQYNSSQLVVKFLFGQIVQWWDIMIHAVKAILFTIHVQLLVPAKENLLSATQSRLAYNRLKRMCKYGSELWPIIFIGVKFINNHASGQWAQLVGITTNSTM